MKGRILKILRDSRGVVSGEVFSEHLGISRVSIWKHIKKLRELGYDIVSSSDGYRLEGDPDGVYPWEFPAREDRIHYFKEVSSTMDVARDLARKGCPHFTVVVADSQTRGRGRLKRIWQSARGGLYFTLVLRPDIPPIWISRINFAVSLVLAETLENRYGLEAGLKWPNDVLVDGGKISGMLSEMEAESDAVTYVSVGIGINVNNDPTAREPGATSIAILLGREVSKKKLLADLLDRLEDRISGSLEHVIDEWKKRTVTLNQQVRIVTAREVSEGTAVDIDDSGALVLALPGGARKRIFYGDCFHSAAGLNAKHSTAGKTNLKK